MRWWDIWKPFYHCTSSCNSIADPRFVSTMTSLDARATLFAHEIPLYRMTSTFEYFVHKRSRGGGPPTPFSRNLENAISLWKAALGMSDVIMRTAQLSLSWQSRLNQNASKTQPRQILTQLKMIPPKKERVSDQMSLRRNHHDLFNCCPSKVSQND